VLKIRNFSTFRMEEESKIRESSMKTNIKNRIAAYLTKWMVYPVTFSFLEVFEYVPPFRVSPRSPSQFYLLGDDRQTARDDQYDTHNG